MKVIFDLGCNLGQNINYFKKKSDVVIAVDANKELCNQIRIKYSNLISKKKLFVENVALSNTKKKIDFYIQENNVMSSLIKPNNDEISKIVKVKSIKVSELINFYKKKLKFKNPEYIKIDLEHIDHVILEDILKNKITPKYLSVECHNEKVLRLIVNSNFKSFKFIKGEDVGTKLKKIKITDKYKNNFFFEFDKHSSGPYGDDIPGDYYEKKSILPYFFLNGLGWTDLHCSSLKKVRYKNIVYKNIPKNLEGFRYHLKMLLPKFFIAIKNRINL
jgi:FkbM family methyltransferase